MHIRTIIVSLMLLVSHAAQAGEISVPLNRSVLLEFKNDMSEVIVANPDIADVYAHGTKQLSVIGKAKGNTTVRILGKNNAVLASYIVNVGYDLPSIRKALRQFIPEESINVETINEKIALTGKVSSAVVADQAVKIAETFVKEEKQSGATMLGGGSKNESPVLNFMQVASSQQVMLRVRVGELKRSATKNLGLDWATFGSAGNFFTQLATGTGTERFVVDSESTFTYALDTYGQPVVGFEGGNLSLRTMIKMLERDGLFKLLAEPTLTAISGEQAEFLAGGEIPIPVPQEDNKVTLEFKPYGVAVKFRPYVLTKNRIRIEVEPEVSELDQANAVRFSDFNIPAFTTRRAKTTVELAPGEAFMIGGLLRDDVRTGIDQLPGMKDLPVLGALFRSSEYQRNETELVIAVTPYIVDPMKSSDVKLPSDGFVAPTQMDVLFHGNLSGTLAPPALEGPSGFMTE